MNDRIQKVEAFKTEHGVAIDGIELLSSVARLGMASNRVLELCAKNASAGVRSISFDNPLVKQALTDLAVAENEVKTQTIIHLMAAKAVSDGAVSGDGFVIETGSKPN